MGHREGSKNASSRQNRRLRLRHKETDNSSELGHRDCRLRSEQFANHAAKHLAGCHPATARRGFQFHGLPQRKQQCEFHNLLIRTTGTGCECVEEWLHGITYLGKRVRVAQRHSDSRATNDPTIGFRPVRGIVTVWFIDGKTQP